jgi:hypothetical protein
VVHKAVEHDSDPPHQTHIIALIGVLQTTVEVFDGSATELYPDAHGVSFSRVVWHVFFERYTRVLMEASPAFQSIF